MELKVKLVDDNVGGADDKIDPCLIKLQRLDLDTISTEIRRKIDNNIFSRCAYSILKNLYGIWRGISCRWGCSQLILCYIGCLRMSLHQPYWTPSPALECEPRSHCSGTSTNTQGDLACSWNSAQWSQWLVSTDHGWRHGRDENSVRWCTNLGLPDRKFMNDFKGALGKIAQTTAECDEPIVVWVMFEWVWSHTHRDIYKYRRSKSFYHSNIPGMPVNCIGIHESSPKTCHLMPTSINGLDGAWHKGCGATMYKFGPAR
jgi:hypothetical protein